MKVPAELAELPQWVLWRAEGGTKIPYSAIRPGKASSSDADSWAYLVPTQTKLEKSLANGNPFSGIGFMFTNADPYCGIDLDGCRDPETGIVAEWAQLIIDECGTYSEISPSGTGVKLFCRGKVPKGKKVPLTDAPKIANKSPAIEFYDWGRYFTFTGNHLASTPLECCDCQPVVDRLWRQLVVQEERPPVQTTNFIPTGDQNRFRRCDSWVAKMPASISGAGGDEALYTAACECARFGCDHAESLAVMRKFNARCQPPWSESRLLYKIEQGRKTVEAAGEFGIRLREDNRPSVDLSGILRRPSEAPQRNGEKQHANDKTPANKAKTGVSSTNHVWRNFPTDCLPGVVRRFVRETAKSIDCDESMVALPTICTLAGAIGCTRYAMLKSGWSEPSVFWAAVIAESGSKKSPSIDAPLKAVVRQEMAAIKEHEQELVKYSAAMATYKADLQQWQRDRKGNNPTEAPQEPTRPICRRTIVSDPTIEALADRVKDNPRGLLLKVDELAGHFGGMNQYKARGKGGDEAKWLAMHGARELIIDRKNADRPTIAVRRAAVSIIGGIQPAIFRRQMGREQFESGMAARFLLVNPPPRVSLWTEDVVSDELETAFANVVFTLQRMEFVTQDDELVPVFVPLTREAKERFRQFHDEHAEEAASLTGDLSAAWSKQIGYAARLALVIQFAKWAESNSFEEPSCIDLESMESAITLAQWFAHETKRNYLQFSESDDQRNERELIELIQRHGGEITPRDLNRNSRRFADADQAELALNDLVSKGVGIWLPIPPTPLGGRPSRRFSLTQVVDETPANHEKQAGSVIEDTQNALAKRLNEQYGQELKALVPARPCSHDYPAAAMNVNGRQVHCPGCGAFIGFVDEYDLEPSGSWGDDHESE